MARKIAGFPGKARVEALIINEEKILTIHRKNHGQEYWVLPGGGWEENESQEEGVAREVWEETSLKVEVLRPVFSLYIQDDGQKLVYLCKYLGGTPVLGNFNEKKVMEILKDNSQVYEPQWVPISQLSNIKLYTLEFRDWFLENYKNGQLPNEVCKVMITKDNFRE